MEQEKCLKTEYKLQVEEEHYNFENYVNKQRWMSYWHQVKEALASGCKSFLYIGKGDGIVTAVLSELLIRGGIIDTFDFDKRLNPTYVGDIRTLSTVVDKQYDCVICCQVLEHIEYDYFEPIIKQISNICGKRFILSLPQRRLPLVIRVDFGFFHPCFKFILPMFWEKAIPKKNSEHFWEVAIKKHGYKDICNVVSKYFIVKKRYTVSENTYHWFVIAEHK